MADNENKTHCLMQDCIISQFGRCNAGSMLSESDVDSDTWLWLERQGFLKSVESIEQEADADPVVTETTEVPTIRKGRTGKKTTPETE